ncbi:MAG TPA: GxxExxY protein [Gemmataceae bacterium]|jgi:GxxExxY protein|nr:GxxExxY protein [Gemmataceae bacterium]
MIHEPIPAEDDDIAHRIIGAAIDVHRLLGPGFLESVYEKALLYELQLRGLNVERQKDILVPYKDIQIEGQRLDLLVAGRVIVELKAVEALAPIHQAQLLSYLKATKLRLGLIINFNVPVLKDGIKRLVR